jgi:hypothetical protein
MYYSYSNVQLSRRAILFALVASILRSHEMAPYLHHNPKKRPLCEVQFPTKVEFLRPRGIIKFSRVLAYVHLNLLRKGEKSFYTSGNLNSLGRDPRYFNQGSTSLQSGYRSRGLKINRFRME